VTSVWESVLGQPRAVEMLRRSAPDPVHAYLLVGPEGCGIDIASRALAAHLLTGADNSDDRDAQLVMRGAHPDVHEIRRAGASILAEQADDIIRLASITPSEGSRKVIIVHEVHLMAADTAARLLKTVEEPPRGVHFVLVAEQVVDVIVTIASRCVTVHFGELDEDLVVESLVNRGVDRDTATAAARASHGNVERALLLATDPGFARRREMFAGIPRRLDGSGATVVAVVDEILRALDDAAAPLEQRHSDEVVAHEESLAVMGVKRGGKKALEDRHKRELRRHRTDELRSGLAEIASVYRDELALNPDRLHPQSYTDAVDRLHDAMRRLALNVNEAILLRDLIWSLPSPSSHDTLTSVLKETPA
jgi:DNA polymerase-3 subunit delta'